VRFVILGGGPAGNQAATHAARLGVEVTLVERDIVGGSANLLDCIPSKAMIATGAAMSFLGRAPGIGLADVAARLDLDVLRERILSVEQRLEQATVAILESQGVDLLHGTGRLVDAHTVVAETAEGTRTI